VTQKAGLSLTELFEALTQPAAMPAYESGRAAAGEEALRLLEGPSARGSAGPATLPRCIPPSTCTKTGSGNSRRTLRWR